MAHAVRDLDEGEELYRRAFHAEVFHRGACAPLGESVRLLLVHRLCIALVPPPALNGRAAAYLQRFGGRFASVGLKVDGVEPSAERLRRRQTASIATGSTLTVSSEGEAGLPVELLAAELPNDPRREAGWSPRRWGEHALALQELWTVSTLVESTSAARAFWAEGLGAEELGVRPEGLWSRPGFVYAFGEDRLSITEPKDTTGELARVLQSQGPGVHATVFAVTELSAVSRHLRGQGLAVVGNPNRAYTVHPRSFLGARFTFLKQPPRDDVRWLFRNIGPPTAA